MNGIKDFFLFCSGSNATILKRAPSDVNKMAGIGATIFFTGVFAFISGAFALYSVFHSYTLSIIFGMMWGLMIFNLDRFIVMSIKKKESKWSEFGMALPRILLAVLIAFVIAKPLELKLFQSEINNELTLMEQERFKEQEDALKQRFDSDIKSLKEDLATLNARILSQMSTRDTLVNEAIAEADGTGGSMQRNLGPIYATKKAAADQADVELKALQLELQPQIMMKQDQLKEIENLKSNELISMKKTELNGFAAQLDALGRLGKKSTTIFWASIFITLLFMAIETAPLFTKLISSRSPYDFTYDLHEMRYLERHAIASVKTKERITNVNIQLEEIEKYERQLRTSAEKEILNKIIKNEVERIKSKDLSWKDYRKSKRTFG